MANNVISHRPIRFRSTRCSGALNGEFSEDFLVNNIERNYESRRLNKTCEINRIQKVKVVWETYRTK